MQTMLALKHLQMKQIQMLQPWNLLNLSSRTQVVTKVAALWDYENAWGLEDYNIRELKRNIEAALKTFNPDYVIDDQIVAVGPGGSLKYHQIKACRADFKIVKIPWENLRCDDREGECFNLVVTNLNKSYEQTMRKTDGADKYLVMELYMKVLDNYDNILVISSDADFLSTIASLNKRRKFIMLATDRLTNDAKKSAKAIWLWPTMIIGGIVAYRDPKLPSSGRSPGL